jgi:hypothetical protein
MVNLKIPPEKAILLITQRIDAMNSIQRDQYGPGYYDVIGWGSKTWPVLDEIYGSGDPHSEELRNLGLSNCSCNAPTKALILAEAYHSRLLDYIEEIRTGMKTQE